MSGERAGRPVVRMTVLVATLGGLSLLPVPGGSASCAAPYLQVPGTGGARPVLHRGERVTVEGRAMVDGCNDGGGQTLWGCSTDELEPQVPFTDVVLSVRQHGAHWRLGTADAGTAEGNRLGRVTWSARLPAELEPGRALLVADPAHLAGGVTTRIRVTVR